MIKLYGFARTLLRQGMSRIIRYGMINGLPGFVSVEPGGLLQTTALAIEDGKITGIYVTRNPDKLGHLGAVH
jgi:RNA polymerase sigma-70 factor (ECF subfamily)